MAGPVIITELSNRAKAALPAGGDRVHIYDTPLQVLAGLLAVGFVADVAGAAAAGPRPIGREDRRIERIPAQQ